MKVLITLPIAEVDVPTVTDHVGAVLDRRQAETLGRVLEGLVDKKAKLAIGDPVTKPGDVVRFILERIDTEEIKTLQDHTDARHTSKNKKWR